MKRILFALSFSIFQLAYSNNIDLLCMLKMTVELPSNQSELEESVTNWVSINSYQKKILNAVAALNTYSDEHQGDDDGIVVLQKELSSFLKKENHRLLRSLELQFEKKGVILKRSTYDPGKDEVDLLGLKELRWVEVSYKKGSDHYLSSLVRSLAQKNYKVMIDLNGSKGSASLVETIKRVFILPYNVIVSASSPALVSHEIDHVLRSLKGDDLLRYYVTFPRSIDVNFPKNEQSIPVYEGYSFQELSAYLVTIQKILKIYERIYTGLSKESLLKLQNLVFEELKTTQKWHRFLTQKTLEFLEKTKIRDWTFFAANFDYQGKKNKNPPVLYYTHKQDFQRGVSSTTLSMQEFTVLKKTLSENCFLDSKALNLCIHANQQFMSLISVHLQYSKKLVSKYNNQTLQAIEFINEIERNLENKNSELVTANFLNYSKQFFSQLIKEERVLVKEYKKIKL